MTTLDIASLRGKDFDQVNSAYRQNTFKAAFGASLINPSTRLVNAIINAAVIAIGSVFLINKVNVGVVFLVGDLSAFLTYAANYMKSPTMMARSEAAIKIEPRQTKKSVPEPMPAPP